MRIIPRLTLSVLLVAHGTWPAAAQTLKTNLGQEKATAAEAMLSYVFPNSVPFWDTWLYAQTADHNLHKISLTDVARLADSESVTYVAGVDDWDKSDRELSALRRGKPRPGADLHANLVAVRKGVDEHFTLVALKPLEPGHQASVITHVRVASADQTTLALSYSTFDLQADRVVEIDWYARLDKNLSIVRKWPNGATMSTFEGSLLRLAVLTGATSSGVIFTDSTNKQIQVACSAICELSAAQIFGNE